jgi:hypothetical protein
MVGAQKLVAVMSFCNVFSSEIAIRCTCGKIRGVLDDHKSGCRICIGCEENNTCDVCAKWPASRWRKINQLRQKRQKDDSKQSTPVSKRQKDDLTQSDGEELAKGK